VLSTWHTRMAFCCMVYRSNMHVTVCMGTVSTSTHYTWNISVYKRHTSVTTAVGFIKQFQMWLINTNMKLAIAPRESYLYSHDIILDRFSETEFLRYNLSSGNPYYPPYHRIDIECRLITFVSRWDCGKHIRPTVERIMALHIPVGGYRYFGITPCFHLQDRSSVLRMQAGGLFENTVTTYQIIRYRNAEYCITEFTVFNFNFLIFNSQSRDEHRRSTVPLFVFLVVCGVQMKTETIRTASLTVLCFRMLYIIYNIEHTLLPTRLLILMHVKRATL